MGTAQRGPTTRRHRTKSVDVSSALLVAAEEILATAGVDGLTIRAVASRAGVAPMGVYSRFSNKDGLIDALFARGFQQLLDAMTAVPATGSVARLRAAGDAYRDFALAHPHVYRLMFSGFPGDGPSAESEAIAAATFDRLVMHVSECMATGDIAEGDPVMMAQMIWNGVHGAVSLELAGVGFTEDPNATFQAMNIAMVRGLAP